MSNTGNFARQRYWFLVASVVARDELGQLVVEDFVARQFGEPALDVTGSRRRVAGEDVAVITLALDEVTLVRQHHERVADGSVAVRMILHRVSDDVGDLDEAPVVLLLQRPEDATLHRLQTVLEIRNRAVANDVGRVLEKVRVDAAVEREIDLARRERHMRDGRHFFGLHMGFRGGRFALALFGRHATRCWRRHVRAVAVPISVRF
jgi:hypothetical protein